MAARCSARLQLGGEPGRGAQLGLGPVAFGGAEREDPGLGPVERLVVRVAGGGDAGVA